MTTRWWAWPSRRSRPMTPRYVSLVSWRQPCPCTDMPDLSCGTHRMMQNIGYVIPVDVVLHFLEDIERHGEYTGTAHQWIRHCCTIIGPGRAHSRGASSPVQRRSELLLHRLSCCFIRLLLAGRVLPADGVALTTPTQGHAGAFPAPHVPPTWSTLLPLKLRACITSAFRRRVCRACS